MTRLYITSMYLYDKLSDYLLLGHFTITKFLMNTIHRHILDKYIDSRERDRQ